jgi:single-strand DNA-binding protein
MSDGLNKVILMGNLGADPELKATQGGQSVLKLRLATTESYLDKSNTRQERTEWHSVTVWGKRGEALARILHKGSTIFVEGGLRTSSYEKDGEKRYRTEIVANNVILGGNRPKSDSERDERGYSSPNHADAYGPAPTRQAPTRPAAPAQGDFGEAIDSQFGDEEIPF